MQEAIVGMVDRIPLKWIVFLLIVVLGLVSSLISAILAAIIAAEFPHLAGRQRNDVENPTRQEMD